MDDDRERAGLHEAAHALVASLFGWEEGPLTVEGGRTASGCYMGRPMPVDEIAILGVGLADAFCLWPTEVRSYIEAEALVALAGDLAEELLVPRKPGRFGPGVTERAAAGLNSAPPLLLPDDLPSLPELERSATEAAVSDPALDADADRLARLARVAHGSDVLAAGAWIGYMDSQCRSLLVAHETRIRRLADAAVRVGTLSGEAVAALLKPPRDG